MKSDLTPCKKVLYFDKMQKKIKKLLFVGLFVSIMGMTFSHTKEYSYLFAFFVTGTILNASWKRFFISGQDIYLTEEEIEQAKKEIEEDNFN